MNNKNSFVAYTDWSDYFEDLTDEELGQLTKALFLYASEGEEPSFTGAQRVIFRMMKNCLDRDAEKWRETCRKRSESGTKGAYAKAEKMKTNALANASFAKTDEANPANADFAKTDVANLADTVTDTVTDTDTVTESESETETETERLAASPLPLPGKYGSYENILLTEEEYTHLCGEFSKETADRAIEEMSEYCASSGKDYKSYPAALRRWIRKSGSYPSSGHSKAQPSGVPKSAASSPPADKPSYDLDEWIKKAMDFDFPES